MARIPFALNRARFGGAQVCDKRIGDGFELAILDEARGRKDGQTHDDESDRNAYQDLEQGKAAPWQHNYL
jgi:hypothetical protein